MVFISWVATFCLRQHVRIVESTIKSLVCRWVLNLSERTVVLVFGMSQLYGASGTSQADVQRRARLPYNFKRISAACNRNYFLDPFLKLESIKRDFMLNVSLRQFNEHIFITHTHLQSVLSTQMLKFKTFFYTF